MIKSTALLTFDCKECGERADFRVIFDNLLNRFEVSHYYCRKHLPAEVKSAWQDEENYDGLADAGLVKPFDFDNPELVPRESNAEPGSGSLLDHSPLEDRSKVKLDETMKLLTRRVPHTEYAHSSKDSNWDTWTNKLKQPENDAGRTFAYCCYEVAFQGEVDLETGDFWAHKVNDVDLVKPIRLT